MDFKTCFGKSSSILMEGALGERLKENLILYLMIRLGWLV